MRDKERRIPIVRVFEGQLGHRRLCFFCFRQPVYTTFPPSDSISLFLYKSRLQSLYLAFSLFTTFLSRLAAVNEQPAAQQKVATALPSHLRRASMCLGLVSLSFSIHRHLYVPCVFLSTCLAFSCLSCLREQTYLALQVNGLCSVALSHSST